MVSGDGGGCCRRYHHGLVLDLQAHSDPWLLLVVDCAVWEVATASLEKDDAHRNDLADDLFLLDLLDLLYHDSCAHVREHVLALVRVLARRAHAVWLLRVPSLRLAV